MTRAEENVKNLEEILEAAASLNEQDQVTTQLRGASKLSRDSKGLPD